MVEPIAQSEPTHPAAREEYEQRLSLVQALKAEQKFLSVLSDTTTNTTQKSIFSWQAELISRILARWTENADFEVVKERDKDGTTNRIRRKGKT